MPDSQAQVRLAHAVASGSSSAMPVSAAKEIISKMHGRSMSDLPKRKYKMNLKLKSKRKSQ